MTRNEALEILDHNWTRLVNPDYTDEELGKAQDIAIEALDRQRGEWMYLYEDNYKCSICGSWWACTDSQIDEMNYCPSCGCAMAKGECR